MQEPDATITCPGAEGPSPPTVLLTPGTVVANRFVIEECLGVGGFAIVGTRIEVRDLAAETSAGGGIAGWVADAQLAADSVELRDAVKSFEAGWPSGASPRESGTIR